MINSTAYYAHSKMIYGTEEESHQLKYLKSQFKRVICPNNDIGELGNIQGYLDLIEKKCDAVVFAEWFYLVGRGVWDEVKHARKLKLPIYGVKASSNGYALYKFRSGKIVDKNDWRNYAKLICEDHPLK